MSSNKRLRLSDPSSVTPGASLQTHPIQKRELVKIMEFQDAWPRAASPVIYDVGTHRSPTNKVAVGGKLSEHEKEENEAEFIKKIVGEISLELRSISFGFDEKLVGKRLLKDCLFQSLKCVRDEVRMIAIKAEGGVVEDIYSDSLSGLKKLQEQVLSDVLKEDITVTHGQNMMKERMRDIKVLLVLDDVDHIDQLKAVNFIRAIDLLSDKETICLFSRYAFGSEIPSQGYEELSQKVVRYAAGLPLTVKVLGSFLCGKDKDEWVDAIKRLEKIPLKETLEKLELRYISLEYDYKEIFLDIACV
ncbi:Toll/interleukin-1 receptor domain-containing protein, partial [Tanacetum coccineum]